MAYMSAFSHSRRKQQPCLSVLAWLAGIFGKVTRAAPAGGAARSSIAESLLGEVCLGENGRMKLKKRAVLGVLGGSPGVLGMPGVFAPSVILLIIRLNCIFLGLFGFCDGITLSKAASLNSFNRFCRLRAWQSRNR